MVIATHSSTLAWKIPWTEEPGRLQSMESLKVGHDWETSLSLACIGEGNGSPLQCSCLENPSDGRAWWAAVYGVSQSQTRLKWLSSSSSMERTILIKSCICLEAFRMSTKQLQLFFFFFFFAITEWYSVNRTTIIRISCIRDNWRWKNYHPHI